MMTVVAQVESVQEALENTALSIPQINKKFLQVVGKKTLTVVRSGIRQTYSKPSPYYKRTGQLLRAWTYKVKKDGSEVNVYPKIVTSGDRGAKNRQWAMGLSSILSYGTSDGRIKPRCFIQNADNFASNGSYMAEVQKMVDKELEKYWGK